MLIRTVLALFGLISPALAQNVYLVQPDLATAQARSQQQCVALGCDGTLTKFWWNVLPLIDGTAAIEIQPNGTYGMKLTVKDSKNGPNKTGGLTVPETSALVSAATIAPKLPPPPVIGNVVQPNVVKPQ